MDKELMEIEKEKADQAWHHGNEYLKLKKDYTMKGAIAGAIGSGVVAILLALSGKKIDGLAMWLLFCVVHIGINLFWQLKKRAEDSFSPISNALLSGSEIGTVFLAALTMAVVPVVLYIILT